MLLRRWTAVAVCVLAMAGTAYAQSQWNDQKRDSQQQQAQPEHAKAGPSQSPISGTAAQPQAANERPTQAKIYEPDCRKPKDQPEADLCTQRRVADAAEQALQYTLAQTVIGALGVAFVVVTLGFTARANKAASIAAQAAVDAVGAERAWVTFDGPSISGSTHCFGVDGTIYNDAIGISLIWKNTGRSPAQKVNLYVTPAMMGENDKIPLFEMPEPQGEDKRALVGPGVSGQTVPQWLVGEELKAFRRREKRVVLYSKVTYEAVLQPGVERESEVCIEFTYNGTIAGNGNPNLSMRHIGTQNRAT